jgi:hypothetical protein
MAMDEPNRTRVISNVKRLGQGEVKALMPKKAKDDLSAEAA